MKQDKLLSTAKMTAKMSVAGLLVMSFFGLGCAKKNESTPPIDPPAVAATPDPNQSRDTSPGMNYQAGGTATFVPDDYTVLGTYVATHPLNQPSKFQVNVNVRDLGSGQYGGVVQISYYDNGNYYNGYFESGTGTVQISTHYNGQSEAAFNKWFTYNGQNVFHGFFQDKYGAIMIVVDDALSNGDGGAPSEVNGSIYFKNFAPQNCTNLPPLAASCGQSALKCWFTEAGPFDCRTFVDGNGIVQTTSSLYPGNGYTRLGKFTALNYKKAFNVP